MNEIENLEDQTGNLLSYFSYVAQALPCTEVDRRRSGHQGVF